MLAPSATLPASHFSDITADAPDFESLRREYDAITASVERAETLDDALRAFSAWDSRRRFFDTWASLTELQFRRNTADPQRKAAVELLHELRPKITGLDVTVKRKFLGSALRKALEGALGTYLFARWEMDVTAYDPVIEPLVVQESALENEYTELLANASIEFRGERLNLSTIGKYAEDRDRETRRAAQLAKWSYFSKNGEQLDRIYGDLVRLRDKMARDLDLHSFTELGYRRLTRTDYGPAEVARWREEIVREIVPLAGRIVTRQARDLGIDRVMLWDEDVFSPAGSPKPPQRYDDMLCAARSAFDAIDTEIGAFARMMIDRELLDLQSRDGKAGGGFCTSFPAYGLPYVFANFNGTTHDVNVLVHELGHAFQNYSSRNIGVADYLWPTYEACEVHSMSLEFFAWPQLERFFGADAQRYRLEHLKSRLLILPYAAAIDHFQHFVYDNPEASPEERHAFWKQLETAYLPWRRYDGIEHLERGGYWQVQRHVYFAPFYYIDYTLALCCAMQFWVRSQDDYAGALRDYTALCKRGGQLPFQELVRSAGLQSPFEAGVLSAVAKRAAEAIGV
ncbi:MAG TPA: M3 family oligoendopeptidase [Candidatus Baltobacteraceae bacterium]|jgi:M3 family oligoendopeptidase|nr:M3 family oligoendopeptidase [Candidatus Baltobacteraceae bacterium]